MTSRMHSRFAAIAVLAVALGASVLTSHDAIAGDGWTKIDSSDGITIYKREVAGSDVIAFRGEGVVDAPFVRVASAVFDTSRAAEWIDSLTEARVVRRTTDLDYVEYDHFAMPFVMTDRDFVTQNRLTYDAAHKAIVITIHSVVDPNAPPTGFIRGNLTSSTFVFTATPDGKTMVVGDVHCDPRGSISTWLVNFFQKDWPHSTLKRLRTQVAKANILENPAVRKLVTDGDASIAPK